jgi:hypothetical protein
MFCSNCNYFLPWTESTPAESAQKTDMPRRPQNETPPPEIAQPAQRAKSAPPSTAGNRSGRPAPGARADTAPPAPRSSVPDIMAAIDAGREIASRGGRSDLEQHLGQARERLSARTIPVVVAGEFKQGKSSMINALLQREVCPVDADVVTAVPTTVRYADKPQVSRYVLSDDGQRVDEETMPFDSLPRLVTERANPDDVGLQLMIEVGLPHRMLRSGLALVDTPGVGGLQSADGHLTLGALGQAEGVLFVSAAAQELTGPELAFLRTAAERCPRIALVMPKIDLYPHWRRIVEINRGHLARASLPIPIIPISSLLRFRAGSDPELSAESRFADLVAFLARDIVAATRDNVARSAAVEVEFVAAQLQQQAHAERAVIAAPERAAEVVAELDTAQRQASKLAAPTATWQVTLGDGIAKLESDIDFDLQQRFREILHEAEAAIDEYDPKDVWTDLDAWLRRELAVATVTNRDLLVERAEALAATVAEQFEMPRSGNLVLNLDVTSDALDQVVLAPAASLQTQGGKLMPLLMAGRTGYLPLMVGGALVGVVGLGGIGIAVLTLSALLGGGIGRKIFRDELERRKTIRQQAAKTAVRKFIEEVSFLCSKQARDCLRSTRQQLRDDFQARAVQLERSAREATYAAERVRQMDADQQRERDQMLARQQQQLELVRTAARTMSKADGDE